MRELVEWWWIISIRFIKLRQNIWKARQKFFSWNMFVSWQGLEGEDDSAISMVSDNTAKLTSAVRYLVHFTVFFICFSDSSPLQYRQIDILLKLILFDKT